MQLIADFTLAGGAFAAAIYCYILALRLKKFQTLETGMGSAIAVLSAQVDDMTQALEKARTAANGQANTLEQITKRGEAVAARLELTLASMHDLPEPNRPKEPTEADHYDSSEKRLRFVRRRGSLNGVEATE